MPDESLPRWAATLEEGVVLVRSGMVVALNDAASDLLKVPPVQALEAPVIALLRDHRIEGALVSGEAFELVTRGRTLAIIPFDGGFVIRDESEERRASENARELLAVLSHELRTPVTTIRGALETLAFDLPEAQRVKWLQRAEREAERLVRLLEDLTVDVAPPRARSVPLREIAERVGTLLAPLIAERQIDLRFELPNATVWADPDKLLQVLLNLLENATLHGPATSVVTLHAELDAAREGWWRLEVRDLGEPGDPEAMERWFAPHTRSPSATQRGTGLGLYIVRSIVRRWGGETWGRPWSRADLCGNAFGFTVPSSR
jgi:signal transduction histidine kinase